MDRLKEIKEKTEKVNGYSLLISIDDVDWLIEQAETIEQIQEENKRLLKRGDDAIWEAGQLWAKIYNAKEALK